MFTAFVISLLILLKTSESSQQSLLLATDGGIKTLSLSTWTSTTLYSQPVTAVDFRYKSKDIYFISNSSYQIFYCYYSEYLQRLSEPIPRVTSSYPLTTMAVDWVSYTLYYASEEGYLVEETLRAKLKSLFIKVSDYRYMAIDPYEKLIFYYSLQQLFSVTYNNFYSYHDLRIKGRSQLSRLALDLHTKDVYIVCQEEENQWVLRVKNYEPSAQAKLVFIGKELEGVRALAVYHGQITWAAPCEDVQCLYSCQRDACQDTLAIAWKTFDVINDIKYYSPLAQTPDLETACALCSHGCQERSAVCACPEGMEAGDDSVQCKDKPPTWDQRLQGLLDGLLNSSHQWFNSLATRPYWYIGGGLALAMLLFCVCFLATIPCSKPVLEKDDDFPLSETNQEQLRPNRPAHVTWEINESL